MPKWKVPCWNCDEGFVGPVDEWGADRCDHCRGRGFLIVTELTDDNCEEAIQVDDNGDALRQILSDALAETWCPFCKKSHVGGDTCMGHHP